MRVDLLPEQAMQAFTGCRKESLLRTPTETSRNRRNTRVNNFNLDGYHYSLKLDWERANFGPYLFYRTEYFGEAGDPGYMISTKTKGTISDEVDKNDQLSKEKVLETWEQILHDMADEALLGRSPRRIYRSEELVWDYQEEGKVKIGKGWENLVQLDLVQAGSPDGTSGEIKTRVLDGNTTGTLWVPNYPKIIYDSPIERVGDFLSSLSLLRR